LRLFQGLQQAYGFACLFISHDLAAVEQVADRVAVMEAGRIVEIGSRDAVFDRPQHPYTRAILAATPALAGLAAA
ncbi:MAG: ABC transporter ATP-binding protein, partial [Caulobacteraceae bacterium]|nr:ABC transporter ATP-binding protein [Caulobacteraceae bacterium]